MLTATFTAAPTEQDKQWVRELLPGLPAAEAAEVVAWAFQVGSGRVARVSELDLDDQINRAVGSHIRHWHTDYDDLLRNGWDREDARSEVAEKVKATWHQFRSKPVCGDAWFDVLVTKKEQEEGILDAVGLIAESTELTGSTCSATHSRG